MNKEINNRIKEARKAAGISQNRLAKLAKISQSGLSAIESGRVSPTLDTTVCIANAIGASVDWIATGKGDVNTHAEMWNSLKYDIGLAVDEGIQRGLIPETESYDCGKLWAYTKIYNKMIDMENREK